jgi:hypothetical protein
LNRKFRNFTLNFYFVSLFSVWEIIVFIILSSFVFIYEKLIFHLPSFLLVYKKLSSSDEQRRHVNEIEGTYLYIFIRITSSNSRYEEKKTLLISNPMYFIILKKKNQCIRATNNKWPLTLNCIKKKMELTLLDSSNSSVRIFRMINCWFYISEVSWIDSMIAIFSAISWLD